MKQNEYMQYFIDLISQQHNDLQAELNWFLAVISLIVVVLGLLQWKLSENQIKKMKADFRSDYGIDELKENIKESKELNQQLIENIATSFLIQIRTSGSLLPMTTEKGTEAFKGNIMSNFTASLKSAYSLDALTGDILSEATALLENYLLSAIKDKNLKELSYPIIKNLDTGVKVIETAFSEQPIDVNLITDFETHKKQFYDKFNVEWQLNEYTPYDNPTNHQDSNK